MCIIVVVVLFCLVCNVFCPLPLFLYEFACCFDLLFCVCLFVVVCVICGLYLFCV